MRSAAEGTLTVDGIRRSVFFFASGPDRLYASVYSAADPVLPPVVLCPAWGGHLVRSLQSSHELGAGIATAGGTALLYHPPGDGDSEGEPATVTPRRFAEAAADAADALREWSGSPLTVLAGVRLGALVAAAAWRDARASAVLFLQPLLDLTVAAAQLAVAGAEPAEPDGAAAALAEFTGPQLSVHLARPSPGPVPAGMRAVEIHGDWRRPPDRERLLVPVREWLAGVTGAAA